METDIRTEIENQDVESAVRIFDESIDEAYSMSREKHDVALKRDSNTMKMANDYFERYRQCIKGEIIGDSDELLKRYQDARKNISKEVYNQEQQKWIDLLNEKNSKNLWEKINWKGTTGK